MFLNFVNLLHELVKLYNGSANLTRQSSRFQIWTSTDNNCWCLWYQKFLIWSGEMKPNTQMFRATWQMIFSLEAITKLFWNKWGLGRNSEGFLLLMGQNEKRQFVQVKYRKNFLPIIGVRFNRCINTVNWYVSYYLKWSTFSLSC